LAIAMAAGCVLVAGACSSGGGATGATGSGGSGGSGGGSGGVAGGGPPPVMATTQIDTSGGLELVVAPDERHVAVLRDQQPAPTACTITEEVNARAMELGTVAVVTLPASGAPTSTVLGAAVRFGSVAFSADARWVTFVDDYDPCAGRGDLEVAAADGTGVRRIEAGVTADAWMAGSALFYFSQDGNERVLALSMPGATPIVVPEQATANVTGDVVAYIQPVAGGPDGVGSLQLLDLSTGTTHTVTDGVADAAVATTWSNTGKWLAFAYRTPGDDTNSQALVASDGTGRTELAADSGGVSVLFAPDDALLAYETADGSAVVVHRVAGGGADVRLSGLPASGATRQIAFSRDGRYILATAELPADPYTMSLYAAAVATSGSFTQLVTGYPPPNLGFDTGGTSASFVAVSTPDGTVQVMPLAGGAGTTLAATNPRYRPMGRAPLLLDSGDPDTPGFFLASPDGSAPMLVGVPGFVSAIWLGGDVLAWSAGGVQAMAPGGPLVSIVADVGNVAWASVPSPTAVFFIRQTATASGAAGLWAAPLP
jgi:hypothetical protein